MSFDIERTNIGREPISIVELHLDYCSRTYGEGVCQAAVGVTGSRKCFNTRTTCQDLSAYNVETKIYRFSTPCANVPANLNFIPSIRDVSFSPTKIDPGKSMGRRGQCTIAFQDHPHHDVTIDKYVDERDYDPMEIGTFWTKFKVRNRYYNGRIIKIYSGYVTAPWDWDNFQTRTYVIDQITGPDARGGVSIVGRDILKLADDERAVCPRPTTARLSADLAAGAGNFTVLPAGSGSLFAEGDYLRIDKEIILIDSIVGDVISFGAGDRGQFNTEDKAHKADDAVQLCKYIYQQRVDDIIYDLLVNYGNVPASYIDLDQWESEASIWLGDYVFTSIIVEPTGITTLLNELIQNSTSYIFWDEREAIIKLLAVKPPEFALQTINENNSIITGSVKISEKPDKRRTEVAFYFNVINPVEKLTDASNFQNLDLRVDVGAESEVQYNDIRTEKIYSRWLNESNGINTLSTRFLNKYRNIPVEVNFRVDAKDIDLWTGDEFYFYHRNIVDETGERKATLMRIIEAAEAKVGTYYDMLAVESEREFEGRYCYVQENDEDDFPDIPIGPDREFMGGWICSDSTLLMSDGSEAYKIL